MKSLTRIFFLLLALSLHARVQARPNPLDSIRPLEQKSDKGEWEVVCTTFAVYLDDHGKQGWMTAGHCYFDGEARISGVKASFETALHNDAFDGALLSGGPKVMPLRLAYKVGAPLTPVYSAGYPHGTHYQHVVAGVVGGVVDGEMQRQLFNVPVMPGMSGSPVLDKSDMVVGMLVLTECQAGSKTMWCPFSLGTPLELMRAFLYGTEDVIKADR